MIKVKSDVIVSEEEDAREDAQSGPIFIQAKNFCQFVSLESQKQKADRRIQISGKPAIDGFYPAQKRVTQEVSELMLGARFFNKLQMLPFEDAPKMSPSVGGKFKVCPDNEKNDCESQPKHQLFRSLKGKP